MSERPSFFKKELTVKGYTFYLNEQHRAFVPRTKEEFKPFIDTLFALIEDPTVTQKVNYALIKKYPFLLPKNRWDGGLNINGPFDFSYNELYGMPNGWLFNFGEELVTKLASLLEERGPDTIYRYFITDIKEKYGTLRWYDGGATDKMYKVINEYEVKSASVCLVCGEEGEIDESVYWLEPLCPKHKEDRTFDEKEYKEKRLEVYKRLGDYNV